VDDPTVEWGLRIALLGEAAIASPLPAGTGRFRFERLNILGSEKKIVINSSFIYVLLFYQFKFHLCINDYFMHKLTRYFILFYFSLNVANRLIYNGRF